MTITTNDLRNEYTATGGQTVFSYTFKIFADTDLNVYQTPAGQEFNDATDIITGYSVSGAGVAGGGSITLNSGATAGDRITIVCDVPYSRTTAYQNNGDFLPETVNNDVDRAVVLAKQADAKAGRALLFPECLQGAQELTIPAPSSGLALRWKSDLSGMENFAPTFSDVTGPTHTYFMEYTRGGSGASVSGSSLNTTLGISLTAGDLIKTDHFDSNKTKDSGALLEFTGTTTLAKAGNCPDTDGYFYDADGKQFKIVGKVKARAFGALGINDGTDDTAAIQIALNYAESLRNGHFELGYDGDFSVTQITIGESGTRLGTTYDFCNSNIVGAAVSSTSSAVQIKVGSNHVYNLKAVGPFDDTYESGIHWYTNDLNTFYPGFVKGLLWKAEGFIIGLCIGALPSQSDPIPAQNTVQTEPDATDAPLSESIMLGLEIKDCVNCVYMRQPNGKLTFVNPTLVATNASFAGTGASAETEVCALTMNNDGSELSVLGGSVENVDDTTGALVRAYGGTLNIIGTVMESKSAIEISGNAKVRVSNILNWGLNQASAHFFRILDSAEGSLDISDSFLLRGFGYATQQPMIKTVSSFSTGSGSVNEEFIVNFSQVNFGDPNFLQGSLYNPLVFGCRAHYSNCWITNYSGGGVRQSAYHIDEEGNRLLGSVDLAAKTITAYGVNATATSGGWSFSNAGGGCSWGSYSTGLPTIEGVALNNVVRMLSVSSQAVSATSPKFDVMTSRFYLLKGWIKTGSGSASLIIRANYYDFGGTASAVDASLDMFNGPESQFGTTWRPFEQWFAVPSDATQMELFLYVENGAEIQFADLKIV